MSKQIFDDPELQANYCETCEYLCYSLSESNYKECMVFGDCEPPEEYATEDGCNCSNKLLQSILEENENARNEEYSRYIEWYKESEEK